MKNEKMTGMNIVKKLEGVERDIRELRETIMRSAISETSRKNIATEESLCYTLEDLYEAFGNRKHYAIRLQNALTRKGISTLSGFLALSTGEVLELDGVGFETLLKTKKALERLNIKW